MENEIIIKLCDNITSVACLHKEIFADHLLGMLPVKLIEAFYSEHNDGENLFLCAEVNGKTIGFVMGGESFNLRNAKKRFLAKNKFRFGWHILCNRNALKLFIETYLKRNKACFEGNRGRNASFRLLSIGVNKIYQGKGVAQQLLSAYEDRLRILKKGGEPIRYGLSVHRTNIRAIYFYRKMGFRDDASSTVMNLFLCKTISQK